MNKKDEIRKLLEAYGCFDLHQPNENYNVIHNEVRNTDLVDDLYNLCMVEKLKTLECENKLLRKQLSVYNLKNTVCTFYIKGNDTSGNCNNCGKPQYLHD